MRINGTIKPDTLAHDLIGDELWFPVRTSGDDGHEFICLKEWGADIDHAHRSGLATEKATGPSYCKTNPIVRYARLKIIACEIKE